MTIEEFINLLANFGLPIFLLIALVLFKFLFGFERGRNRYTKDIIYEVIIFLRASSVNESCFFKSPFFDSCFGTRYFFAM